MVDQGIDEPRDIGGTVLPVSIESHNVSGALLQRKFDAGLERGALPQIDRVGDDGGAGRERNLAGRVMGAVIDNDDAITSPHEVRNYGTDNCGFVESRNNDPNQSGIGLFRLF